MEAFEFIHVQVSKFLEFELPDNIRPDTTFQFGILPMQHMMLQTAVALEGFLKDRASYIVERVQTSILIRSPITGRHVMVEPVSGPAEVRGSTRFGALIDCKKLVDEETQRALYNSMITVRRAGFPALALIAPLEA